MKTLKIILSALVILTISTSAALGKSIKPIKTVIGNEINLDLVQFGKYLENGNSHPAEGVYTTSDERYVIAIVKNDERSHDFIGVVISADNEYWKEGEVKFNFVVNSNNQLEGLYYDSKGESHPMNFELNQNGIDSDLIYKLDAKELLNDGLAVL